MRVRSFRRAGWWCSMLCLAAAALAAAPPAAFREAPAYVAGRFEQQRSVPGLDVPVRAAGRFQVWRGHGVYWAFETPAPRAVSFTAQGAYLWRDPGARAVPLEGLAERHLGRLFLDLLDGDPERLAARFELTASEDPRSGRWWLSLRPKEVRVARALARIDLEGGVHLERLEVYETGGGRLRLEFTVDAQAAEPPAAARPLLDERALRACCLAGTR